MKSLRAGSQLGCIHPTRLLILMALSEIDLSGTTKEMTLKAFYVALAYYDEALSLKIVQQINAVGKEICKGHTTYVGDLISIAKGNNKFYEEYKIASKQLQALHATREKNKQLSQLDETAKNSQFTGIIENLLAPNPQGNPQSLLRTFGDRFLKWVSQIEVTITIKQ